MALHMAFCRFDAAECGREEAEASHGKDASLTPDAESPPLSSRTWQRRFQSQVGRDLLATLMQRHYPEIDIAAPAYAWVTGENGKPRWLDSHLHFSIAHSQQVVIAAIGESPLGVDVEAMRPVSAKCIERFLPAGFRDPGSSSGDEEIQRRFLSFWTACESLGKLSGAGVFAVLNRAATLFVRPPSFDLESETRIRHYPILPGFLAAVCGEYAHFPEYVTEITFSHLRRRSPRDRHPIAA